MSAGQLSHMEPRSYRRFQLFAWGFLGGYILLFAVANPQMWRWESISVELGRILGSALLSHVIVKVAQSWKWFALERARLLWKGAAACALGGLALTLVFFPLAEAASPQSEPSDELWLVVDYVSNTGVLAMWGGFFLAFYYHDVSRKTEMDRVRLAAATKELQLSTLRNQLNPHFLFNSFNLLRALVQRDPEAARDSITHLSEMMRHSLSVSHCNTIPLTDELEFVDAYLALERLRYEERLRIDADVPHELRHLPIPPMLLHTLIENAVKYGIDQSLAGVQVRYAIRVAGQGLCLRVTNGGRLVERGSSTGTGLVNLRQRLALLYGDEASLVIAERDGQVVAEACWPVTVQEGT